MGTRADFYVGRGVDAEWIGSVGYDGYPDGLCKDLLRAKTRREFRAEVARRLKEPDGTTPDQGWPWPWDDSHTSDYAYAFDKGQVWATDGSSWWPADKPEPAPVEFPNMASRRNLTLGHRSGILLVSR